MFQAPLAPEYTRLVPEAIAERIGVVRASLGDSVLILGHHYQRDEIIRWADYRGDSYKLSRQAAEHPGQPTIVFCGVHFMAESADLLTEPDRAVLLPNMAAGCSMADMASVRQVQDAWDALGKAIDVGGVVPITYVNSAAALKAFVGRHGGSCCTSANARKVLEWALSRGQRVMFFPDQHLGRNTAVEMGFDPDADMALWDPHLPAGGLEPERLRAARFILWKGHCSVHQRFTVEQIERARRDHPSVRVIVHPECALEVVRAADANGSTERIIEAVRSGEPGSVWAVGTEIHLVSRLQKELPDRRVFCLDPVICPCSTMYRIHPRYLLWVLESLASGVVVNRVRVAGEDREPARLSLERMLAIS
ncbi:MAG TPA: quinolinate synthase NadA [Chthonomonadales bacterium]|nr:quinolinate synthase NadA [Chthonomonadales bacterium]